VVPILLLVGLLVVLGHVHIDLATGYTAPRIVADGKDVLVFFDEGGREPAFYWRRSEDGGRTFGDRDRVLGVFGGAVVHGERVVALLGEEGGEGTARWFFSLYEKKTLERLWSDDFKDPELGLTHPRQLAKLGETVFALGTDAKGALRVAQLGEARAMLPTRARLADAAAVKPGEGAARVPPPALLTAAQSGAPGTPPRLLVFWRVLADPLGPRLGPGELRCATLEVGSDGPTLVSAPKLAFDLAAATAVTTPEGEVLLIGAPAGEDESSIRVYRMRPSGPELQEQVPYEREGFTGGAGVAAISAAYAGDRLLVVAQIGGAIRYCAKEGGAWSKWDDLARVPTEQKAVVYGWGLSMLTLSGALIVQGLAALRRRRRRRPEPPRDLGELCARALEERARAAVVSPAPSPAVALQPQAEPSATATATSSGTSTSASAADPEAEEEDETYPEAAPLPERCLAFVIDLVIVLLGCALVLGLLPGVLERSLTDPRAQLALGAMFIVALIGYFAVLEAVFARTPGKRLLDLEVQDLAGGRPTRGALLFRNLFRVELLLPPPYLAMIVSLLVMMVSPQRQRPGDLLARTAVRRVRLGAGPTA
jgi:uncharacterized RDD family membrane protein YckC